MTVVAWDGKILASDRRVTSGHTISTTTKIFRLNDGIIGFAGIASGIHAFLDWFVNGRIVPNFPEDLKDPEFGLIALFIDLQKRVWQFDSSPSPLMITAKKAAIGSGDEAALALMHAGKTAIEAVQLTCKVNSSCGNGYDYLILDEKKGKKNA